MSTDDQLNAQVAVAMGHCRGDSTVGYFYLNPVTDKLHRTPPPWADAPPDSDEAAKLAWEMIARLHGRCQSFRIAYHTYWSLEDICVKAPTGSVYIGCTEECDTLLAALARAVVACAPTDAESATVQEAWE